MRKKTSIDTNELIALSRSGYSQQALSIRFRVSLRTIQYRLKDAQSEKKDAGVMQFATELEKFSRSAPNPAVKKEMLRMVLTLRTRHAAPPESKKRLILDSINSGAREVEEIAEECEMRREECLDLLDQLVAEKRIAKRARGGVQNRGRKTKFHYHIFATEKINTFPQVKSRLEVADCPA